jgi:hypothetical protein
MRKLSTTLLFAAILLAGALTALPLYAEGNDRGMKNEQCDMMRGRQGSMLGGGGMMQGDRGGMMGQGGMMGGGQGGMMQGSPKAMMGMMKQMSQMMKQMGQMMEQYSNMMGENRPKDQEKKEAPSESEKK